MAVIVISRGLARSFRALTRKCVAGKPRGPAPTVAAECRAGIQTVWTQTDDAVLVHTAPASCGDGLAAVPMAVLEAVEGSGTDPVVLTADAEGHGLAQWVDQDVPRTHAFAPVALGSEYGRPEEPTAWQPLPPEFLRALHECGRTAARDAGGRFALTRVQLKGTAGQVAGTDSHSALVWGGFVFNFADDRLVPALPVFGSRELTAGDDVKIGTTGEHSVIAAGPWRVFLKRDADGRFPDVAGIAPRDAPTVLTIDDADAAALLAALPRLPLGADESRAVTLDADRSVAVRAQDAALGTVEQVRLERSSSTGPPARLALDRRMLARALTLGCRTVRIAPGRPVVYDGGAKRFITMALDAAHVVETTEADTPSLDIAPRRTAMKSDANGTHPNGRHDPPVADPTDPLEAAVQLQLVLGEAEKRAARLVAALRATQKEKKALTQVWSSLRALNLGPGGTP